MDLTLAIRTVGDEKYMLVVLEREVAEASRRWAIADDVERRGRLADMRRLFDMLAGRFSEAT